MSINCQYILNRYIMTEFILRITKPVVLVTGFPKGYGKFSTAGHKYVLENVTHFAIMKFLDKVLSEARLQATEYLGTCSYSQNSVLQ